MGLATLGAGFMMGEPLFLLFGAAAYALGWIYVPDMPFFRRWVQGKRNAALLATAQADLAAFNQKREALIASLTATRKERYFLLARVCRDIETSDPGDPLQTNDPAGDPRMRKLDELMWAYLRMLGLEESLENHLEREQRDNIPGAVKEVETEITRLTTEFEQMKKQSAPVSSLDAREKLITSRLEKLEVLKARLQKLEQVQANRDVLLAELERLEQQIKLIRADSVANTNADSLSARIDASFTHLAQTNKWLSEMEEFKDLGGDLPDVPIRAGYGVKTTAMPALPPQLPPSSQEGRKRVGTRE